MVKTALAVAALIATMWLGCTGVLRAARTPVPAPAAEPAPSVRASALRQAFERFAPTTGAAGRLRLLVSNADAWVARWRLLAGTRRSLDVTYFILEDDVFGVAFLGHLLAKAEEGARIRMLLDAFGTKMSKTWAGSDYLDELANADHASVRIFRPRLARYLEGLLALDPAVTMASEHDKIIVADGQRSLIGGRNIASEYFVQAGKADAFHDTDLQIDSARVGEALTRTFEAKFDEVESKAGDTINLVSRKSELLGVYRAMDAWLRAKPTDLRDAGSWRTEIEKLGDLRGALSRPEPTAFEAEVRVLDSPVRVGGATTADPITKGLVQLVGSAQRTILIQSPYLVLSKEGAELLAEAGRRGVATTILTNSPVSSDNALSQAFFLEQWPELLARVPKLRLFVGGRAQTLHDKVAVFDDELALVGTYNLDPTSMALNSEVVAAAWSVEFARAVAKEPRRIIAAGPPNVYEYTITRDRAGNPVRDADGHPHVTFGPRDHCTPEQWAALGAYWTTLKAVKEFTGFSPLF